MYYDEQFAIDSKPNPILSEPLFSQLLLQWISFPHLITVSIFLYDDRRSYFMGLKFIELTIAKYNEWNDSVLAVFWTSRPKINHDIVFANCPFFNAFSMTRAHGTIPVPSTRSAIPVPSSSLISYLASGGGNLTLLLPCSRNVSAPSIERFHCNPSCTAGLKGYRQQPS